MQYELQKKLRRNQGARGLEVNGLPTEPPSVPPKDRDTFSRARNGSGTSRTTVSDSGETDSSVFTSNQSSLPSPPQSSAESVSHPSHFVLSPTSTATLSSSSSKPAARSPPSSHATVLSPIATRVREMDADAMEKYMRRTRSGSQGTSSPSGSQQTTGATIQDDEDTLGRRARDLMSMPKKLRPSASAAQLRTSFDSLMSNTTATQPQTENRTRAGTNPTTARPTLSPIPMLTRSTTSDSLRSAFIAEQNDEDRSYTGPPSQYAEFPDPPDPEDPVTPVNRRKGLHMLLKSSAADAVSHRRGMSATSVRGS